MNSNGPIRLVYVVVVLLSLVCRVPMAQDSEGVPMVTRILPDGGVGVSLGGKDAELRQGGSLGKWTLMAVIRPAGEKPLAIFENFSQLQGRLVFAGERGKLVELSKTLEPTWGEAATLYRGHTLKEVFDSERDLLAEELLAADRDPEFAEVASCFSPIAKMYNYTFVGTGECPEKVGIQYGGVTPNFDPAAYVPEIAKIRASGRVMDGLAGGWLPVIRFVYPEKTGAWTEMLVYAPMRVDQGNTRVQPVWYRVSRVEEGVLRWARYFDSYHPVPPRGEAQAEPFYEQLLATRTGWNQALERGMTIQIPDERLSNLCRHSLVREMMTRIGGFPKYGVFDRSYGGSEHDGFPDTFTVDTTAMLQWGLFGQARRYIENYFRFFVRDDGSILYRGPETGQYGRMLTVVAEYARDTGDIDLLLRHRRRIDAVVKLLLSLREQALRLPGNNPAYGMIAGWSEADACIDPDPQRYVQPYFSNSTEAARGFQDLGEVWAKAGSSRHHPELSRWGKRLQREAAELNLDIQEAIARSVLTNTHPACLPAIAGVKQPFDEAVTIDKLDPQLRSYRAYMEMLYSGNLTREQAGMIIAYRAAHHDVILGVPTCYGYNTHELAGFLSYGHGFGLLQLDSVREFLLTLYSLEAHQYTRGTWTAPETRLVDPRQFAAPYCAPAQMTVPLLTRWMLVFEDPASGVIWLAKGTPRKWLEDGQTIAVRDAPTGHGRVSFRLRSRLDSGKVDATLNLASAPLGAPIKLRLRVPEHRPIRSVMLNGKTWTDYDVSEESVTLPAGAKGRVEVVVHY